LNDLASKRRAYGKGIEVRRSDAGCEFEAKGATEMEVLMKAAEHAKTAHTITDIPPAMVDQVRGAIRDE
jgi:predicted small metal-binding protein